jgi:hypothetical protein
VFGVEAVDMTSEKYPITLKKSPGAIPGENEITEYTVPAIKITEVQKESNSIAGSPGRNIYLLTDCGIIPVPGDIIRDGAKEFSIIETKICRDISGRIRAVRCITLN